MFAIFGSQKKAKRPLERFNIVSLLFLGELIQIIIKLLKANRFIMRSYEWRPTWGQRKHKSKIINDIRSVVVFVLMYF